MKSIECVRHQLELLEATCPPTCPQVVQCKCVLGIELRRQKIANTGACSTHKQDDEPAYLALCAKAIEEMDSSYLLCSVRCVHRTSIQQKVPNEDIPLSDGQKFSAHAWRRFNAALWDLQLLSTRKYALCGHEYLRDKPHTDHPVDYRHFWKITSVIARNEEFTFACDSFTIVWQHHIRWKEDNQSVQEFQPDQVLRLKSKTSCFRIRISICRDNLELILKPGGWNTRSALGRSLPAARFVAGRVPSELGCVVLKDNTGRLVQTRFDTTWTGLQYLAGKGHNLLWYTIQALSKRRRRGKPRTLVTLSINVLRTKDDSAHAFFKRQMLFVGVGPVWRGKRFQTCMLLPNITASYLASPAIFVERIVSCNIRTTLSLSLKLNFVSICSVGGLHQISGKSSIAVPSAVFLVHFRSELRNGVRNCRINNFAHNNCCAWSKFVDLFCKRFMSSRLPSVFWKELSTQSADAPMPNALVVIGSWALHVICDDISLVGFGHFCDKTFQLDLYTHFYWWISVCRCFETDCEQ